MKAIYPGSFDPLTLGHLDIIARASQLFDELTILVSANPNKTGTLDLANRLRLAEEAIKAEKLANVKVTSHDGLTVGYAQEHGYKILLRGIRAASDFENELEMSQVNHFLSGLETVFLMTEPKYSFIRASRVWELLRLGADISNLVPANVANYLKEQA